MVVVPVVDRSERNHGCTSLPWSPLAEAIAIIAIAPACSNCAAEGVDQRGRHPSLPVSDPRMHRYPVGPRARRDRRQPPPKAHGGRRWRCASRQPRRARRPMRPKMHSGHAPPNQTAEVLPAPTSRGSGRAGRRRPARGRQDGKAVLARRLTPDTRWTQCAASGGRKPRGCRSVSLSGRNVLSLIDLAVVPVTNPIHLSHQNFPHRVHCWSGRVSAQTPMPDAGVPR